MVYVREAHPTDGWRMESNDRVGVSTAQPRTYDERVEVAQTCGRLLGLGFPMLVDTIDDTVGDRYSGMPGRLYLIDREGKVAYKSGRGPFGFKPAELEQSLVLLLQEKSGVGATQADASTSTDGPAPRRRCPSPCLRPSNRVRTDRIVIGLRRSADKGPVPTGFHHHVSERTRHGPYQATRRVPGIVGPMIAYPETQTHLSGLAEALLRGPSSLTSAERELIAVLRLVAATSATSARSRTRRRPGPTTGRSAGWSIRCSPTRHAAPVSPKMKALLAIADKVRRDGRLVQTADIDRARAEGADDKAIHDTVLIAAAFCMFNRYVDGLGTWAPDDPAAYEECGRAAGRTRAM